MTMPISFPAIEEELSKAQSQLNHLQNERAQQQHFQPQTQRQDQDATKNSDAANASNASNASNAASPSPSVPSVTAAALYQKAIKVQEDINFIDLQRDVAKFMSETVKKGQDSADAAGGGQSASDVIARSTETCTALGVLLLRHPPIVPITPMSTYTDGEGETSNVGNASKSMQFRQSLRQWYNTLHDTARANALRQFYHYLRKTAPEYPSNERSSTIVGEALSPSFSNLFNSNSGNYEWNMAGKCLIELQIVKDALDLQEVMTRRDSQPRSEGGEIGLSELPSSWRLDIVDELCRPLADRVRFHFLEEQTGIVTAAVPGTSAPSLAAGNLKNAPSLTAKNESEILTPTHSNLVDEPDQSVNRGQQSRPVDPVEKTSYIARLPEWIFRYLRETVDDHGVYSQVMTGSVQPLVDSVIETLLLRDGISENEENGFMGEDGVDGSDSVSEFGEEHEMIGHSSHMNRQQEQLNVSDLIHHLHQHYYSHAPTYFLREVSRMARHTLRAKSFFCHPDIVGSECKDREVVLRGIDQLFLFDKFLDDKRNEDGVNNAREGAVGGEDIGSANVTMHVAYAAAFILPLKLTDTFLSTNDALLQWWIEEERDAAIATLQACATVTLASHESDPLGESLKSSAPSHPIQNSTGEEQSTASLPLFPPISELFTAIIYSARAKSISFENTQSRQSYVAKVMAPLCSEFLDLVHGEAKMLRKQLLARPVSSSSSSVVSALRSTNLPSDDHLTKNVLEWASLVTGTHIAAQAVLQSSNALNRAGPPSDSASPSNSSDVLQRIGKSMERLRDAMVEDFLSAFVETIVLERAKLASYMMRCPFVLSQDTQHNRESREGHGHNLSLSPDLNDSFHVLSVAVQACKSNFVKLKSMFHSGDDDVEEKVPSPSSYMPIAPDQTGQDNIYNIESLLSFGSRSIHEALTFAISEKFMEIAIDPQGMCPEIYIGGACQFHHDVLAFAHLCRIDHVASKNGDIMPDAMDRVITASSLMSLDPPQLQSLRDALLGLAVPSASGGFGSYFGRSPDRDEGNEEQNHRISIEDFFADGRLVEEAQSMLDVKGFGALALEEAVSIMNRRC